MTIGQNGWFSAEDTNFTAGESPLTLDIYTTDLHEFPLVEGYIACDGSGNILVEMAQQPDNFGNQFTMKSGEVVTLGGTRTGQIRITHSGTDSSYRIVAVPQIGRRY